MSECKDCEAASVKVWHGFAAGCSGCAARAVARSPEFFAAKRAQRGAHDYGLSRDAYRALLLRTGVAHEAAIAASRLDVMGAR